MTLPFQDNLFLIDFLVGLAFFLLGWSIMIQSPGRLNPFCRSLGMIAVFAMLEGSAAWIDMMAAVVGKSQTVAAVLAMDAARLVLAGFGAFCLVRAGLLLVAPRRQRLACWLAIGWLGLLAGEAVLGAVMPFSAPQWQWLLRLDDSLVRLLIAIPAALAICLGLRRYTLELRGHHDDRIARRVRAALACFALYGPLALIAQPPAAGALVRLAGGSAPAMEQARQIAQLTARALLAVLAALLAVVLVDALRLLQKDETSRDAKTGLLTTPMIYRFIAGCVQQGRPLSVLFIDIDHFKRVNDRHGHLAGDAVLHGLAGLLRSETRSIDCVGRFGGEEFVVVMPDVHGAVAALVAERLRAQVEQALFPLDGHEQGCLPVTVSVGVADWQPGLAIEQLLARADAAMYQAKKQGRNRIAVFEPPQGETRLAVVRLEWHEQWNSGHAAIDAQHRQLLALGNELIGLSLADGSGHEPLVRQLVLIVNHVARHFAYEERLLADLGYARLPAHREAHQTLSCTASAFLAQARDGRVLPQDCFAFVVNDLIVGHLLKEDTQFFAHIRQAGANGAGVSAGIGREGEKAHG